MSKPYVNVAQKELTETSVQTSDITNNHVIVLLSLEFTMKVSFHIKMIKKIKCYKMNKIKL